MGKFNLNDLKEWLTLAEAAQQLEPLFNGGCTEAGVLRLVLDGHLPISVNFIVPVYVRKGNRNQRHIFDPDDPELDVENRDLYGFTNLEGVWDLTTEGDVDARPVIQNRYHFLSRGVDLNLRGWVFGAFVVGKDDSIYRLQERPAGEQFCANGYVHNVYVEDLPEDAVLGIRKEALRAFEQTINCASAEQEKPLPTTDDHESNDLKLLRQAARFWWVNVDENDKTTQPSNTAVADWLIKRGISSERIAKAGATIIRPEWAAVGRKPDE